MKNARVIFLGLVSFLLFNIDLAYANPMHWGEALQKRSEIRENLRKPHALYGVRIQLRSLAMKYGPREIHRQFVMNGRQMNGHSLYPRGKNQSLENDLVLLGMDRWYVIPVQGPSLEDFMYELSQDPNIEQVQPLYQYCALQSEECDSEYHDPDAKNLWGFDNTDPRAFGVDTGAKKALPDLCALAQRNNKPVVIGIVDTGIDYNNPELHPHMWVNSGEAGIDAQGRDKATNGIDDDQNGYTDDVYGINGISGQEQYTSNGDPMDDYKHGTHVSGTIAANLDYQGIPGIIGPLNNVFLMALKFLDDGGFGNDEFLARVWHYMLDNNVLISSNSWGGPDTDELRDLIKLAGKQNHLAVCAAGNFGVSNDKDCIVFPGGYQLPHILSVAAMNKIGTKPEFSDYGPNSVDVIGPGDYIYSTVLNNRYEYLRGTSMATPHATGAAAITKILHPEFSAAQIRTFVMNRCRPVSGMLNLTCAGIVYIPNLFEEDMVAPNPVHLAVADGLTTHQSFVVTFPQTGDDGSTARATQYKFWISQQSFTQETLDSARYLAAYIPADAEMQQYEVRDLQRDTDYYFACIAYDNVGNASLLSDVMRIHTEKGKKIFVFDDHHTKIAKWLNMPYADGIESLFHFACDTWNYRNKTNDECQFPSTYDTGDKPNAGILKSPIVDLIHMDASADIDYALDVQPNTVPAVINVEVLREHQSSITYRLKELASSKGDRVHTHFDLLQFKDQKIRFVFIFNSYDQFDNDYHGWTIYSLAIRGTRTK
jgi:hypothetical protein